MTESQDSYLPEDKAQQNDGQQAAYILPDKFYDAMKFVALVLLPAIGALYFGLAQIWGLPKAEEVVGTITVIDTFLGVVLGISTKRWSDAQE